MIDAFNINYHVENKINIITNKFKGNEKFYLKFSIYSDNLVINKRKGFGIIAYNVDDMALTIGQITPSLKRYLVKLVEQKEDFYELKRVKEFIDFISKGLEPNAAIALFIAENRDLYEDKA